MQSKKGRNLQRKKYKSFYFIYDNTNYIRVFIMNTNIERCKHCKQGQLVYFDETEEEKIFICNKCGKFDARPFNTAKLYVYFT